MSETLSNSEYVARDERRRTIHAKQVAVAKALKARWEAKNVEKRRIGAVVSIKDGGTNVYVYNDGATSARYKVGAVKTFFQRRLGEDWSNPYTTKRYATTKMYAAYVTNAAKGE